MRIKITVLGIVISILFCGCSSGGADVIINADGYEGILLKTEETVVTPMSIPEYVTETEIITESSTEAETPSDTVETETTTTAKTYITSTTPPTTTKVITTTTTTTVTTTEPVTEATTTESTTPEQTTAPETTTEYTTPEQTTAPETTTEYTTPEQTTAPEITTEDNTDQYSDYTPIMGESVATVEQMTAYIKKVNPNVAQSVIDMIPYYLSEGAAEGVRGDVAFAQSCIETANFKFDKAGTGSAVTIDQNNFCGMGVTQLGIKGESFDTPQLGIRAQIQHLKGYGSTEALNGELVDNRFRYLKDIRGCAEYVEWLGIQENPYGRGWAGGKNYGPIILGVLDKILAM